MSFKPELKDKPTQIYSDLMRDAKRRKKQYEDEYYTSSIWYILFFGLILVGAVLAGLELVNWIG